MKADHGNAAEVVPGVANPLDYAMSQRDRDTLTMVREALNRRAVFLAYQPIMQSQHTDRPAFWEALIRLQDVSGRVIPTRDFIAEIENNELGRIIDCLALEMGLQALAGEPSLRLSVNMSARSIGYPRWNEVLNRGLAMDPTVGERLILEITEHSAMLMPDLVRVFMDRAQLSGISFAMDDFGAGYTAFRYLRDFNFDILKIDGQFIRGVAKSPDNQVLVRALCDIARQFDMFTVAEFVETGEDAEWLIDAGVDCLQGFYFSAPTTRPWWRDGVAERSA